MKPTALKLRYYGDPSLRTPCQPVEQVGPAEKFLIESMLDLTHKSNGIGLAAPQVGVNRQIFVLDLGDGDGPYAMVNPKIIKASSDQDKMEEGCLSIPDVHVQVTRPKKIKVSFIDHENNEVEAELSGLLAKAFQHEYDHLQGKLITDYATSEELTKFDSQLKKLEEKSKS